MSMEDLYPSIRKAAGIVASNYPGFIEADDLTQQVAMIVMGTPKTINRLMDYVDSARIEALKKIAIQEASKMRDDYEVFSGQYEYSVDEVKEALEKGLLDGIDWKTNDIAMDCKDALLEISDRYCELLAQRYYKGVVPVRQSADQVATTRAVVDLAKRMNRNRSQRRREYASGDRERRATLRNEEALEQTRNDYEGSDFTFEPGGWDEEQGL